MRTLKPSISISHSVLIATVAGPIVTLMPFTSQASSVYVGYGQSEQTTEPAPDRKLDFTPGGTTALISLDVTDQLSVSADVYRADESQSLSDRLTGNIEIRSWSIGVGYFLDNWSFSASYVNWQDELTINDSNNNVTGIEQESDSPSISVQAGYDWQKGNWQLGTGVGVHYSDWDMSERRIIRDEPPRDSLDEGSSTFISLNLSASYFIELNQNRGMILGLSTRWNQLTDSESAAVSRNGRNISQINNRTVLNFINSQSALGTESYGQVNTFVSYDISENWLVDVNVSLDFGGEESSTAWAVNLGYVF